MIYFRRAGIACFSCNLSSACCVCHFASTHLINRCQNANQRNFSKTQTCHLQTRTPRAFSCHLVTCTYSLLTRHEKNFTREVKQSWTRNFAAHRRDLTTVNRILRHFPISRRIQALKKECRMLWGTMLRPAALQCYFTRERPIKNR